MRSHVIAALSLCAGVSAACLPALAQPAFPPPPPIVALGPPPGPAAGYIVEPGHYTWAGGRYLWVGQQWIPRRPGYGQFVPGHWGPRGRWIPEHWRR